MTTPVIGVLQGNAKTDLRARLRSLRLLRLLHRLARPLSIAPVFRSLTRYAVFARDYIAYRRGEHGPRTAALIDLYPCLHDATATTGVDVHYFYLGVWAANKLRETAPRWHVDVGSQAQFVGMMTALTEILFIDIRPLALRVQRLTCIAGSILKLPFADGSVPSLSCLHVAEHIGLGRYGDPLDRQGTEKACRELARVIAPGGNLFFAVPIGRPRTCFNAHRVHSVRQVLDYFHGMKLVELSVVDDAGEFRQAVGSDGWDNLEYGCGMFWLSKA